jgi:hypothetical protein
MALLTHSKPPTDAEPVPWRVLIKPWVEMKTPRLKFIKLGLSDCSYLEAQLQ